MAAEPSFFLTVSLYKGSKCVVRPKVYILKGDQPQKTFQDIALEAFRAEDTSLQAFQRWELRLIGGKEKRIEIEGTDLLGTQALEYIQACRSSGHPVPSTAIYVIQTDRSEEQQTQLEIPSRQCNALGVLMATQRVRRLPQFHANPEIGVPTASITLYNDIISWLHSFDPPVGFLNGLELTAGVQWVKDLRRIFMPLSDTLWQRLTDVNHQPTRVQPPPEMSSLFGHKTLNKMADRPPDQAREAVTALGQLLQGLPVFLTNSSWRPVVTQLSLLQTALESYLQRLGEQVQRKEASTDLAAEEQTCASKDSSWQRRPAVMPSEVKQQHAAIQQAVLQIQPFQPLSLEDFLVEAVEAAGVAGDPLKARQLRYDYVHSLYLSVDLVIWTYRPGGQHRNAIYIWRLPSQAEQQQSSGADPSGSQQGSSSSRRPPNWEDSRSMQAAITCSHLVNKSANEQLLTRLIKQFSTVMPTSSKFQLRALAQEVLQATGNFIVRPRTPEERQLLERLESALDAQDPDVIVDLRRSNGRAKNPEFDLFWDELGAYLEEFLTQVHERRGGAAYMSTAISVRDLREQVVLRMRQKLGNEAEIHVPSDPWIALQFQPTDPRAHRALAYTGRFQIKYMVQRRQQRKHHGDAHYAAASFKLMRDMAIKLQSDSVPVLFLCMDDKHKVDCGEPSLPITMGARSHHRALSAATAAPQALDHDFHIASITPSVTLVVDIPGPSEAHNFYRGNMHVTLKDSVFQPSSALRHMAELQPILDTRQSSILFAFTDGGPDHNLKFLSVKLPWLALAIHYQLDAIIIGRCAPYHSWSNPGERCMSTINLGLQHCAIERARMPDKYEEAVCKATGMASVRKLQEAFDEFPQHWQASIQPAINIVGERISRLRYSDKVAQVHPAADMECLSSLLGHLQQIEPALPTWQISQQDLHTYPTLEPAVLNAHFLVQADYSLQYFKVPGCPCPACTGPDPLIKPPRDLQQFSAIHTCPFPVPAAEPTASRELHYKPFLEVYGTETSAKHQPSLQLGAAASSCARDEQHKDLFQSSRARGTINCSSCSKPRVYYSKERLDGRTKELVVFQCDPADNPGWVCGEPLFPPGDPLYDTVVVREGLECNAHLEPQYYNSKPLQTKPQDLCGLCGVPGATRPQELVDEYRTVLPICAGCIGQGLTAVHNKMRAIADIASRKRRRAGDQAQEQQQQQQPQQQQQQQQGGEVGGQPLQLQDLEESDGVGGEGGGSQGRADHQREQRQHMQLGRLQQKREEQQGRAGRGRGKQGGRGGGREQQATARGRGRGRGEGGRRVVRAASYGEDEPEHEEEEESDTSGGEQQEEEEDTDDDSTGEEQQQQQDLEEEDEREGEEEKEEQQLAWIQKEPCQVCGSADGEQIICDYCLCCWHLEHLEPPLAELPDGTWLCSGCEASGHREATEEALSYHGRWVVSKFQGVGKLFWGQLSYSSRGLLAIKYEDSDVFDEVTVRHIHNLDSLHQHRNIQLQPLGVKVPHNVLRVFKAQDWLVQAGG